MSASDKTDIPDFPSTELISKLKTYYPNLDESSIDDVENALLCVIGGFRDIFSSNLRRIRGKFQMTQSTASEIFDVSYSSYSAWENGKSIPRASNLKLGCMKMNVDPAELISINPVSPESVFERKVPLISIDFFRGKPFAYAFRDFELALKKDEFHFIPVEEYGRYDYAVEIDNADFPIDDFLTSHKATAFCSWKEFAGQDPIEQMKIANNKLCLIAFMTNRFSLRRVFFDGKFLKLAPINKSEQEYIFPLKMDYIGEMKEPEKAKYLGYDTLAANVQIYGNVKNIALKIIE